MSPSYQTDTTTTEQDVLVNPSKMPSKMEPSSARTMLKKVTFAVVVGGAAVFGYSFGSPVNTPTNEVEAFLSSVNDSSSVDSSQCKTYPELLKADKVTFKEESINCIDIDTLMAIEGFDKSVWDEGVDGEAAEEFTSSLVSILEETEDKIDELMGRKSGDRRSSSFNCGPACIACGIACDVATGTAQNICLGATAVICIFPGSVCRTAQAACRAPNNLCKQACAV